MSEQNNSFHYTYSAKEQKEIEAIRKKYITDTTPTKEDKMEQLRRLDAGVTSKAVTIALIWGIIGALIMGSGMSLVMTDFKEILGSYMDMAMVIGIAVGIVGMIGVIAAYPLYQSVLKRERKRKAPQILKLTEELSQK